MLKSFSLLCGIIAVTAPAIAQRTGINNTNPTATLDVTGTIRTDSIGVGMLPTQRMEVAGNVQIPAANTYQYATPKSESMIISPLAFQKSGTASGDNIYSVSGGEVYLDGGPAAVIGYLSAPVLLPNGAVVTDISSYVLDNSNTKQVVIYFYKTPIGTTAQSTDANANTTQAFSSPDVITLPLEGLTANYTIDNALNIYSIRVTLSNDFTPVTKFYGIKINYTVNHTD